MTGSDDPHGQGNMGGGFGGFPGGFGINIEDIINMGFGGGFRQQQQQQQSGGGKGQGGSRSYTFTFGTGGRPGGGFRFEMWEMGWEWYRNEKLFIYFFG